jgi:hypothetical protein
MYVSRSAANLRCQASVSAVWAESSRPYFVRMSESSAGLTAISAANAAYRSSVNRGPDEIAGKPAIDIGAGEALEGAIGTGVGRWNEEDEAACAPLPGDPEGGGGAGYPPNPGALP